MKYSINKINPKTFDEIISFLIDQTFNSGIHINDPQEMRTKIKESLHTIKKAWTRGYYLMLEKIPQPEKYRLDHLKKKHYAPSTKEMFSQFGNKTLQEECGYDGEMMGNIYDLAELLLHKREFENAADLFLFLTTLNPYVCWFWQGLGFAYQEQLKYEEALDSFKFAIRCNLYDLDCYEEAVRCCLNKRDVTEAFNILEFGLKLIENSDNSNNLEEFKKGLNKMKLFIQNLKK